MHRYVIKRILLMIPTLLGVAIITFVLLRMVPGDIVVLKLAGDGGRVDEAVLQAERARLGLDKPMLEQFFAWLLGAIHLDFGLSMWTGRPIIEEVGLRLGLSLQLTIMASIIATCLAVPSFWLGMLIMIALLGAFGWLPPITFTPIYVDPVANLTQLIWPALAVGYRYCAVVARMIRSSLLEVLNEDYIRTARAKGVFEKVVISRHALRNALLPAITVIGIEFAFLIGGLVVTEQVFNLNGIGMLFVQSVSRNDFTLIQAMVMLIAAAYVVINLVVDLLYAVFDPRIRYT